jgi:flagellar biosynthetic protein FlhB
MNYVLLYQMLGELVFKIGIRLAAVMLVLALFDYVYQRWQQEKDLKMTKQEVKEELKRMDGDPVVKRRRRQVQMELAIQRLQSAVPRADVVVSNPTHLAIALAYDPERMNAPRVVAKGADYVALRIRQIAATAGVPIVERRELARAMYDVVHVGQEIPERFYQAIAEILAYVYELSGRGVGPRAVSVA